MVTSASRVRSPTPMIGTPATSARTVTSTYSAPSETDTAASETLRCAADTAAAVAASGSTAAARAPSRAAFSNRNCNVATCPTQTTPATHRTSSGRSELARRSPVRDHTDVSAPDPHHRQPSDAPDDRIDHGVEELTDLARRGCPRDDDESDARHSEQKQCVLGSGLTAVFTKTRPQSLSDPECCDVVQHMVASFLHRCRWISERAAGREKPRTNPAGRSTPR